MSNSDKSEERLDKLFFEAFPLNHPAAIDWATIKFELRRLRKHENTEKDKSARNQTV